MEGGRYGGIGRALGKEGGRERRGRYGYIVVERGGRGGEGVVGREGWKEGG